MLLVEEGSLYPALHRLENRGWIQRRVGTSRRTIAARKFYTLTAKGRKQLAVEATHGGRSLRAPSRASWSQHHEAVSGGPPETAIVTTKSRAHLAEAIDYYMATGHERGRSDPRRHGCASAIRAPGGREVDDMNRLPVLDVLARDLRYGVRRSAPGPGVQRDRHRHARPRDWSHGRGLQSRRRDPAAPAAVAGTRSSGRRQLQTRVDQPGSPSGRRSTARCGRPSETTRRWSIRRSRSGDPRTSASCLPAGRRSCGTNRLATGISECLGVDAAPRTRVHQR